MKKVLVRIVGGVITAVVITAFVFRGCGSNNTAKKDEPASETPSAKTSSGTESEEVKELRKQLSETQSQLKEALETLKSWGEALDGLKGPGAEIYIGKAREEYQKRLAQKEKGEAEKKAEIVMNRKKEIELRKAAAEAEEAEEKRLQLQERANHLRSLIRQTEASLNIFRNNASESYHPNIRAFRRSQIKALEESLDKMKSELDKIQ